MRGRRVFVTGHTGFKGTWLMTWLSELGATLKGYALAPAGPVTIYEQINGDRRWESVFGDIRDADRLAQEIQRFAPDVVFHLAAQPLVRLSYAQPLETWEVNVMGTANLLNAVRGLSKPCSVVVVTTDKIYENRGTPYLYRETDRLGGHDPYSASKAGTELVAASFRDSFFPLDRLQAHGVTIATVRAGNVFGGGDWADDRLIPDAIRAFSNDQALTIRYPNAIRPWQHVLEPLSGYIALAEALPVDPVTFSAPWNLGPWPQDHLTVYDIASRVATGWGGGRIVIDEHSEHVHEAGVLKLDISKTVDRLGWRPRWSVSEGIERAVRWYSSVAHGADAMTQCLNDIRDYSNG